MTNIVETPTTTPPEQSQYQRRKEYIKAYQRKKYAENATYREHQKAIVNSNCRIKYRTNDDYKHKQGNNAIKNVKKNRDYIKHLEEELRVLKSHIEVSSIEVSPIEV